MKKNANWMFKTLILEEIKKNGGWVNAHAHVDRAFTINPSTLDIYKNYTLEEKWDLVDEVKRNASETEYYDRFCAAIEVMITQGVTALGSFIDIDPVAEDRAIKARMKAREMYKGDITIKFINQTLKGVIEPKAREWFDRAADMVDIIGGLPKRDERDFGKGSEHIDILLDTGKKKQKMVHVHVDQFNSSEDRETELLCNKIIAYNMQHRVVAIHCISIGAHIKEYRERLYALMQQAGLVVIACPVAWIDSKRNETLTPTHNSLTPIDEMIPKNITVALGTDNICDYMVPFCDGNMWTELLLLMSGCRYTDIDSIIKVATINGRKALGID